MKTYSPVLEEAQKHLTEPWHRAYCEKVFHDFIPKKQAFYETHPDYRGSETPYSELTKGQKEKFADNAKSVQRNQHVNNYMLALSEANKPQIDANYLAEKLINIAEVCSETYEKEKGDKTITVMVDPKSAIASLKVLGELNTVKAFSAGVEKEGDRLSELTEEQIDKHIKNLLEKTGNTLMIQ